MFTCIQFFLYFLNLISSFISSTIGVQWKQHLLLGREREMKPLNFAFPGEETSVWIGNGNSLETEKEEQFLRKPKKKDVVLKIDWNVMAGRRHSELIFLSPSVQAAVRQGRPEASGIRSLEASWWSWKEEAVGYECEAGKVSTFKLTGTAVSFVPTLLGGKRPGLWTRATSQVKLFGLTSLLCQKNSGSSDCLFICAGWRERELDKNPNSSKLWGLALCLVSLSTAICPGQ